MASSILDSNISQADFLYTVNQIKEDIFEPAEMQMRLEKPIHRMLHRAKEMLVKSYLEKISGATFQEYREADFDNQPDSEKYFNIADAVYTSSSSSANFESMQWAYDQKLDRASKLSSFLLEGNSVFRIYQWGNAILIKNFTQPFNFKQLFKREFKALESEFYECLIRIVLIKNGVLDADNLLINASLEEDFNNFFRATYPNGIDLQNPKKVIIKLYQEFLEDGPLLTGIYKYLDGIKSPEGRRWEIARSMLTFLGKLDIDRDQLTGLDDNNGQLPVLDEFYGAAYLKAAGASLEDKDPIKSIFSSNGSAPWDFKVDYFEEMAEQGIEPENIRAAAALDYIYELGDRLGIFRITDMLVLMWAQGRLDVKQDSTASSLLYHYYKLRDNRMTPEERAMDYKVVLNKGQARLLSRMVPNEDFTVKWQLLMSEVVSFIQKSERHRDYDNLVSKSGIFQATRDLQYNLSAGMVGKPQKDVHEMYAQLQQCIAILSDSEISTRLAGGSHDNMWGVIENVSRQEFGIAPNIAAHRTAAVEGNKIFTWIAEFQKGMPISNNGLVDDDVFQAFLSSAEAYILAQGQISSASNGNGSLLGKGDEDDFEFEDAEEVTADEFDDWD